MHAPLQQADRSECLQLHNQIPSVAMSHFCKSNFFNRLNYDECIYIYIYIIICGARFNALAVLAHDHCNNETVIATCINERLGQVPASKARDNRHRVNQ